MMRFFRYGVMVLLILYFSLAVAAAGEKKDGQRFQRIGESLVYDSQTGLMWAAQDNGEDVDWYGAQDYCKKFRAGGYNDWRIPDLKELATLYTPENKNRDGFFINDVIRITDSCLWSSYDTMGDALVFSFASGRKPAVRYIDKYQLRVLPVRSAGKPKAE